MYCSASFGDCSVVKSSAASPIICALRRTIISLLTSTTRPPLSASARHIFKILLSLLDSGSPSGSSTPVQFASTRSVPPPGRGAPSRRLPETRSFSRKRMHSRAFAPRSPSSPLSLSSSSRQTIGRTMSLSSNDSKASGDCIITLVSSTYIFFMRILPEPRRGVVCSKSL